MKSYPLFIVLAMLQVLIGSCDPRKLGFGAGSHPYAEEIIIDCPSDTVIARLSKLKRIPYYNYSASLVDGYKSENKSFYSFYFYSQQHDFLLHLHVVTPTSKSTSVLLVNMKDFKINDEWQTINKDLSEERQAEVVSWFTNTIKSKLSCP